ncbi:MAG: hypothetical protein JST42_19530 [Bacteroidetes bacterium]|nr:hypothetical protein [Bacteroidota bacterium]
MRWIIFAVVMAASFAGHSQDTRVMRRLYLKAGSSEPACRELLAMTDAHSVDNDAVRLGYRGAAAMMMARFVHNPISKLNWFNRGRDWLDMAIGMNVEAVELRYLRYCVQISCPRWLGYNKNAGADEKYLSGIVDSLVDRELIAMIREALGSRTNKQTGE